MKKLISLLLGLFVILSFYTYADGPHKELGKVKWLRNFGEARQQAIDQKKPLMVLFDEIPGCLTCVNFGQGPLQHPAVIAAAENEFIPVVVYNNHRGKDREILKKFREPTWNNPVIRFFDAKEKDLIPRRQEYSSSFLIRQMIKALKAAKKEVPLYLDLALDSDKNKLEKATFAMYCYWSGESRLAGIPGVEKTTAGFLNGYEVVDVLFDPKVVSYYKLAKVANSLKCSSRIFARNEKQLKIAKKLGKAPVSYNVNTIRLASKGDRKYQIKRFPEYYYLPLSERQETILNHALVNGKRDYEKYLSPLQISLRNKIKRFYKEKNISNLQPRRNIKDLSQYYVELEKVLGRYEK